MRFRKELLLALISTLFGLALCEAGLRLLGRSPAPPTLEQAGAQADKPLDPAAAKPYIAAMAAAPGTDRAWFLESPPPLPNRTQPRPAAQERFREFERRHVFAPQAEYIWNPVFVEKERCNPSGRLQGFPPTVEVFQALSGTEFPRYRFPPNTTLVSGLVTNAFGFRGHPITLAKPPRTIRIAFVGASTTVDYHYFAYSYPEYVEYWLNRYAEANHLDVRFEALNAGREAIGSHDIAAIVKEEVLPLDPDLVVYYEGANQFLVNYGFIQPPIQRRNAIDPNDRIVHSVVPAFLRDHLALAALADRAVRGFQTVGEPKKPAYRIVWPADVDELNPNPDRGDLPMSLTEIVGDLDAIRTSAESIGGQLAVASFQWLAWDGMPLSPTRQALIYQQLNTVLWPLRYGDIRRMADFQNRVFRNYAAARHALYLDVADHIPRDPNLYIDAIHLTETGVRVKAWVVFQQLAPLLRKEIEAGQLPRAAGARAVPPPPELGTREMSTVCPAGAK